MREYLGHARDRVGDRVPLTRPDLVLLRSVIDHVVVRRSGEAQELMELVLGRIAVADVQGELERRAHDLRDPAAPRSGLAPILLIREDGRDRPRVVVLGAKTKVVGLDRMLRSGCWQLDDRMQGVERDQAPSRSLRTAACPELFEM